MSSQPSSTDLVNRIESTVTYLYQIGGPILMFIGTIGSISNLIVFTQKNLRKNPCSIYFIAYNLANFIYIYSIFLPLTLYVAFNIDLSGYNLSICRLRAYMLFLFNCLGPSYLILASIDRALVTSRNALTRQRSTRRLAYVSIIVVTLFWALFHIHALITAILIQPIPIISICSTQQGVYIVFRGYYTLIQQVATVLLMIICGGWSIKNVRSIRRIRVAPDLSVSRTAAEIGPKSTSSKDRQLILMLLMDILIYAVFNFVLAIFVMYQQITQYNIKTYEQSQVESRVGFICVFSASISFCISCYGNVIVSKTFRKEVKKAFSWNRLF